MSADVRLPPLVRDALGLPRPRVGWSPVGQFPVLNPGKDITLRK